MNSTDFLKEVDDPFFSASQPNAVSREQVRKVFLTDFINDALNAINTGIKSGIVSLTPTNRSDKNKNTDDTEQTNTKTSPEPKITQNPNFVLENAIEAASKLYIVEADDQGMTISEFVVDFFDDYIKGARADYSRYRPNIQKLADEIEAQWLKNPKGTFGMGYSKPLRAALTQLGDLALFIYRQKRGSIRSSDTTKNVSVSNKIKQGVNIADTLADIYDIQIDDGGATTSNAPVGSAEQPIGFNKDYYHKTNKGWVDSKGKAADPGIVSTLDRIASGQTQVSQPQQSKKLSTKEIEQWISGLNTRQKQQLINFVMTTMPAGQDLT